MKDREHEVLLEELPNFGFSFSDEEVGYLLEDPESFVRGCLTTTKYIRMGRERAKTEMRAAYIRHLAYNKAQANRDLDNAVSEGLDAFDEMMVQWDDMIEQDKKKQQELRRELTDIERESDCCPTCGRPR